MQKGKLFGANFGKIVIGDGNFLSLDTNTLVVAKNREISTTVIKALHECVAGNGMDEQVMIFGTIKIKGATNFVGEEQMRKGLAELLNYVKTVKTFLTLNRCKNISEYNKKFRDSGKCVFVVIEEIMDIFKYDNFEEIRGMIASLLNFAKDVGISIVATTENINGIGCMQYLCYKFNNRLVFNGFEGEGVRAVTLGMYSTTKSLKGLEFYYMTLNKGNGSLLSLNC